MKKMIEAEVDIKIDQILFETRQVFLFDIVHEKSVEKVCKELVALDAIDHNPILFRINSPGGSITGGQAIIDTMNFVASPVITMISGFACSMGALISICGVRRIMTENAVWMIHPPAGGIGGDYFSFERDRLEFLDHLEKIGRKLLKEKTKLTPEEIEKSHHGEIWLNSDMCYKKGVVDTIIRSDGSCLNRKVPIIGAKKTKSQRTQKSKTQSGQSRKNTAKAQLWTLENPEFLI